MRYHELQQQIRPVIATLDDLIRWLEDFGAPEVTRVKTWNSILTHSPSVAEIDQVWREMQHIGAHMGYMDYSDPAYNALIDRLFDQMEEVIAIVRRQS